MAHKNKDNVSPYKNRQPQGPRSLQGKHEKPEKIYDLEEANDRLADIFKNHHFDVVNHDQRKALARFYQLLMEQQQTQNFTRLLKLRDIAIKHFNILANNMQAQAGSLYIGYIGAPEKTFK